MLADIRQQVAAGAQHITFGDPDFFNGPGHAIRIVEALHREWPWLTYDVIIKVEHLLKHRDLIPVLRRTNCAFVTTAVESFEDAMLERLDKGHTRAGFLEALELMRAAGLPLCPTFIPFTPWTTRESYRAFLREIAALDLVAQVAPIQTGDPAADSRRVTAAGTAGDARADRAVRSARRSATRGSNPDPAVDRLCMEIQETDQARRKAPRAAAEIFRRIWDLAGVGRTARLAAALARDDSVSDRALVLLSGAYRRAVGSFIGWRVHGRCFNYHGAGGGCCGAIDSCFR